VITADTVKAWAEEIGFLACGITGMEPNASARALDHWLDSGYGGTMRYIHRQSKKRKDPALADDRARSIVVVLDQYYHDDSTVNDTPPRIAKYARGRDYHQVLGARLERLAGKLREHGALHTRCYADTGPMAERELARRAGLGWIGKNAMLLRPGAGSFFFIGEVLTDLELEHDAPFETDHCGSCTRCLEACPTQAFVEPKVLDATRCISYLTIEKKGPIPEEFLPSMEGWAFGCDICNDVCPWNQRFADRLPVAFGYRPTDLLAHKGVNYFDEMDEAEFDERFGGTPFSRPGLAGMRRNFHAAVPGASQ